MPKTTPAHYREARYRAASAKGLAPGHKEGEGRLIFWVPTVQVSSVNSALYKKSTGYGLPTYGRPLVMNWAVARNLIG